MMILPMVVPPTVAAVMFKVLENADYGALAYYLQQVGITRQSRAAARRHRKVRDPGGADPRNLAMDAVFRADPARRSQSSAHRTAGSVPGRWRNPWQTFWNITLPMLRPMIAVAVLFRLVDLLKVFDYIFVLTSGGPGIENGGHQLLRLPALVHHDRVGLRLGARDPHPGPRDRRRQPLRPRLQGRVVGRKGGWQ